MINPVNITKVLLDTERGLPRGGLIYDNLAEAKAAAEPLVRQGETVHLYSQVVRIKLLTTLPEPPPKPSFWRRMAAAYRRGRDEERRRR